MEQPPLIDVEPEDGEKSRVAGCAGCLGKLIPLTAGFLLLLIVLMGVALFIWGSDIERSEEGKAGAKTEQKTGIAGVMDKLKRAVKGEKQKPAGEAAEDETGAVVIGEGGQPAVGGDAVANAVGKSSELAEAVGAEAKSPAERNRLLKEKFGHLEEDRAEVGSGGSAGGGDAMAAKNALKGDGELPPFEEGAAEGTHGGGVSGVGGGGENNVGEKATKATKAGDSESTVAETRKRRGGAFGSSTGSAQAGGAQNQYQRWRGDFSTSGSDLEFEIIYQESGGQLQFRCFVMPYDSQTAKLFQADKGDFLLSFYDGNGKRLVPTQSPLSVPLTKLTAFEAGGKVSGWVARGMIPLGETQFSDLKAVRLGWDFDKDLGQWLKEIKANRGK
jgi:hypothetical protein